jgi:hypothetical protein
MLREVSDVLEVLDSPRASGEAVGDLYSGCSGVSFEWEKVTGKEGVTDVVRLYIEGEGKQVPTLGIVGQLGGLGARPEMIGLVSDADGAAAALAAGLKIARMREVGDLLPGPVYVTTHVCPDAPTQPHDPVPFMGSPITVGEGLKHMMTRNVDAVLSIDTTKGNRIINHKGIAISPTVVKGYILRVSEDLLSIYEQVAGCRPFVFPITMQDITPYGNGITHLNSIMQPCTAVSAPVVGVAITAEVPVAGCGTGASHEIDIELAARYCVEVAKWFGKGACSFYDRGEFERLVAQYGPMEKLAGLSS